MGFGCLCFESHECASLFSNGWLLQDGHVVLCCDLPNPGPHLLGMQARSHFWCSGWHIITCPFFVCPPGLRSQVLRVDPRELKQGLCGFVFPTGCLSQPHPLGLVQECWHPAGGIGILCDERSLRLSPISPRVLRGLN